MAANIVATRYELRERIGAGGVAVVYRAFDRRLERDVALKVLRSDYTQDVEFLARFEREARTAAGLNHPNIVRVDDYGAYGETFFIAMELVEGSNLKEHTRVRGPLSTDEAVRIARQLLSALAASHALGLVHRDVKPQNVLIDKGGVAKLTDFGIARMPASTQLTQVGTTMGTAAYVAPEQAEGSVVGPAADLYGVGLLLYEMLTGRPPFDGDSPAAVIYRQVHEAPRPPSMLNPSVPLALEREILRALEKAPERRHASAEEMSEALEQAQREPAAVVAPLGMESTARLPTAVAPAPIPMRAALAREPARRPAWVVPLVAALAIAVGAALWLARPLEPAGGAPTTSAASPTGPSRARALEPTAAPPTAVLAPAVARPTVAAAVKPTGAPEPPPPKPAEAARPTDGAKPTQAAATAVAKPEAPSSPGSIEDTAFQGGFRNPGASIYRQRSATWAYGAQTPYSTMRASFELPSVPTAPARLVVIGLDSEDGAKTPIAVSVNGVGLFSGPAPFENDTQSQDFANAPAPWREHGWAIPAGALRSGTNTIEIRNLAASSNVGLPPFVAVDAARVELGR